MDKYNKKINLLKLQIRLNRKLYLFTFDYGNIDC